MRGMNSMVGTQIGHYRLNRLLDAGGMAAVLEGTHVVTGQAVAVKVLLRGQRGRIDPIARLVQEGRIICSILHEHVVRVLEYGTADESIAFIVMELLIGRPLAQLLDTERLLEPRRAAFIAHQVCDGLHAAHARGIIHRDIKPSNVFLVDGQRHKDFVKVVDFGIAKLDSNDPSKLTATDAGMTLGTPDYMSPEQATADELDARSDVYQVGVLLFEMLTGQLPFQSPSPIAVMRAHLSTPPPDVRTLNPDVPLALAEVVARCLSKAPDLRYPDARVLARVLEQLAEQDSGARVTSPARDDITATVANMLRVPALGNRGDFKRYARSLDEGVRTLWPDGLVPNDVHAILETADRLRAASGELELEVAARRGDADVFARTLEARRAPIERAITALEADRGAAQAALNETLEQARRLEERVRVLDAEYAEVYARVEHQQYALHEATHSAQLTDGFRDLYREGIDTDMARLSELHARRAAQAEPLEHARVDSLRAMRAITDLQAQITQLEMSRLALEAERTTQLAERELLARDAELRCQAIERALEHQHLELGLALRHAVAARMER